ncbi:MAG: FAD/NAD(P)-binding protein [Kiloniellaceae bacterium]
MIRLAIVGLGSWGLCVLDRVLAAARAGGQPPRLAIDIIEPGLPGPGVHDLAQPDYLLLNTPCGQVNLFGSESLATGGPDPALPAVSFYEWARRAGFRIVDGACRRIPGVGRPVMPEDFLPRSLLGQYLHWVFSSLLQRAGTTVGIAVHRNEAVNLYRHPSGCETIELQGGETVLADFVFLTTGHTEAGPGSYPEGALQPYPGTLLNRQIAPGERVAVSGLGLVAVDVVTALTQGRGGSFAPRGDGAGLAYRPSGREPEIALFSRNGRPFCCRPVTTITRSGPYEPVVFTATEVARLAATPSVDFRSQVLPLLWAEMQAVYYGRKALLAAGASAEAVVRRDLEAAWKAGHFAGAVAVLAGRYGAFDPESRYFGDATCHLESAQSYQNQVLAELAGDLAEAEKGEAGSPDKAAAETLRTLRDALRACVDLGRLNEDSHREFFGRLSSQINRVVVGPPVQRGYELRALAEAGVVSLPFGPAPQVWREDRARGGRQGWTIVSTRLAAGVTRSVDHLVAGYLLPPAVDRTASGLLRNLREAGRIRPLALRGGTVAGVDVTAEHHPLGRGGEVQPRLFVLGPLVEGARYFNHYIPSPGSRSRAFHDAESCIRRVLAAQPQAAGD